MVRDCFAIARNENLTLIHYLLSFYLWSCYERDIISFGATPGSNRSRKRLGLAVKLEDTAFSAFAELGLILKMD